MTSDSEVAFMAFFGGKFDFLCYLVNTESKTAQADLGFKTANQKSLSFQPGSSRSSKQTSLGNEIILGLENFSADSKLVPLLLHKTFPTVSIILASNGCQIYTVSLVSFQ